MTVVIVALACLFIGVAIGALVTAACAAGGREDARREGFREGHVHGAATATTNLSRRVTELLDASDRMTRVL